MKARWYLRPSGSNVVKTGAACDSKARCGWFFKRARAHLGLSSGAVGHRASRDRQGILTLPPKFVQKSRDKPDEYRRPRRGEGTEMRSALAGTAAVLLLAW